jgi:acetolactate decarboxylase
MNRTLVLGVAAMVVVAGIAGTFLMLPSPDRERLYQFSTLDAIVGGDYSRMGTAGELLQGGDLGVGTFEHLDGEMIVINGRCYQAAADGTVREVDAGFPVSFAQVTFFDVDGTVGLDGRLSTAEVESLLLDAFPSEDAFFMVRLHGTFDNMTVRSVPVQEEPYPALADALEGQRTYGYADISGTLVGLWSPAFAAGLSSAGFHFHFISDDLAKGGHVLAFSLSDLTAEWDQTSRYAIEMG